MAIRFKKNFSSHYSNLFTTRSLVENEDMLTKYLCKEYLDIHTTVKFTTQWFRLSYISGTRKLFLE